MDENMLVRFKKLFDISNNSLDVKTHHIKYEYTLNYPRTAMFLKLGSAGQEKLYLAVLSWLSVSLKAKYVDTTIMHRFELGKDGNTHVHGIIDIEAAGSQDITGLGMYVVETILSQLPKRSQQWLRRSFWSYKYLCFKSPPILLQYIDELERENKWIAYINKNHIEMA